MRSAWFRLSTNRTVLQVAMRRAVPPTRFLGMPDAPCRRQIRVQRSCGGGLCKP